ncbi:MAG: hypothetical protein FWD12_05245 [Alphaproteobacteria bacterium]|nr:hypothetical protein [Alphaproteobacteria bacterium]
MLAAHADWSVDPRKRWVSLAYRSGDRWAIAAPRLVGEPGRFLRDLLNEAAGSAVVLGVDLPLGLPRHYAAQRPETGFVDFLRRLRADSAFFDVAATLDEIGLERPFYPLRGIKGMRQAAHAAALGLDGPLALRRACDRATPERPAGAPLFWTLGPNQVGKAALAAWRDVLIPALAAAAPLRIWPFEGAFRSLVAAGSLVIAETYPAEARHHLGLRRSGSKRRQSDRAAQSGSLHDAMGRLGASSSAELGRAIADGFGADAAGEDRFDSLLGLLCVLNVLAGNRPDTVPSDPWIARWEGWVLGQAAIPLAWCADRSGAGAGAIESQRSKKGRNPP